VDTPIKVRINDIISAATVEMIDTEHEDNCLPHISEYYELGPRINAVGRNLIYSSATGLPIGCNQVTTGIVPLFYGGNSGYSPNKVMFAKVSSVSTVGESFNVCIDTKIVFDPYVFTEFAYTITDNDAVYEYWGEGKGATVHMKVLPSGKKVTIENVGGFVRFVLGEHNHPQGLFGAEGVQRIK
ncbi:hypothetical protein, partial [Janthinobacterium sp.]|uniref:hypothetical protein n=1 Tax=Janthinobacterium sp. TaxID=1871054 RepID=UPI002616A3F6